MTEPYNMSQGQRDAATIEALMKQLQDAQTCITALCVNQSHLRITISALELARSLEAPALMRECSRDAAHQAAEFILKGLAERGELYERLARYEQWLYSGNHHTSRMDALRSTMTVARP